MIKPATNILFLIFFCCGACEQQTTYRPPRLKPSPIKIDVLLQNLQQEFSTGYLHALEQAEPLKGALVTALTEEKLHHRSVLAAAYTPSSDLRFVSATDLTPAGNLLQTRLEASAEHGLDPEAFHVSRIALLRQNHLEQVTRLALLSPPEPPRPDEIAPIKDRLKALAQRQAGPRTAPIIPRVISWLVGKDSPIPRIASYFAQARIVRRNSIQATARLELTLADGLLQYAHVQDRGNLKPIEQQAKRDQDQLKASTAPAAEADAPSTKITPALPARAPGPPRAAPKPESLRLSPLEIFMQKGPQAYIQSRLLADLNAVQGLHSLRHLLDLLPPQHPQYARLVNALRRYRELEMKGGWSILAPPRGLRPGRSHPVVLGLKQRLALEGFFKGALNQQYDHKLVQAIETFRQTHQLSPAGPLNAQFWRSLNEPVAQRVRSIMLNLQRWRESGIGQTSYYVLVNIPDFHLEVWKAGRRLARHKVVVGRNRGEKCDEETERKVLAYATPLQSALIKTLVFCPYWNVTRMIKETELDPEQGKDPLYYAKHGFELMKPGTRGEWVRELPGPANSLGFVKFLFPNPHETYLHDTPDKNLFHRPVRAFSHGCMRVESPWDLAKRLLTEDQKWEEASYQHLLQRWKQMDFRPLAEQWDPDLYEHLLEQAQNLEQRVELTSWVDIFVEYYTVRVDDAGQVHFLTDIYDRDQQQVNPRPAQPCIPESKKARQGVRSVPQRLAALEQIAAMLAPRVLLASALIHTLGPKTSPDIRRLIKKMDEVSKFSQYHQSLTQRIKEAHAELDQALKKRSYSWNDRLQEQAIRVERLITALDTLSRKARAISDEVIKLTPGQR